MAFRIKLDEDLSPLVGEPLREAGYIVLTVTDQGWSGRLDTELWPLLIKENVFFVTADRGFGDIRLYSPGTHPGILVLRPDRESILEYRALLSKVVSEHRLETLSGCISVVTQKRIRIRRPS